MISIIIHTIVSARTIYMFMSLKEWQNTWFKKIELWMDEPLLKDANSQNI